MASESIAESFINVVIIGAGLAGLTTAHRLLSEANNERLPIRVTLLEARSRIGGRTMSPSSTPLDLGASWIWNDFGQLHSLIKEIGLDTIEQYCEGDSLHVTSMGKLLRRPYPGHGGRRIRGGSKAVSDALASALPHTSSSIKLNACVSSITYNAVNKSFQISYSSDSNNHDITADYVVISIPPRLCAHHISFTPSLPRELLQELAVIPTWMSGSVKTVLFYNAPFWRKQGLSGFARTHAYEFHDASLLKSEQPTVSNQDDLYALFCFSSPPFNEKHCINTAVQLFGEEAAACVKVDSCDWSREIHTDVGDDGAKVYGHPNPSDMVRRGQYDNRLWFGGSECAEDHAGYMEGAVARGIQVAREVMQLCVKTHIKIAPTSAD